jgi:hypothetical protein
MCNAQRAAVQVSPTGHQSCRGTPIVPYHTAVMVNYRIVPLARVYRVEAIDQGGHAQLIDTWPTEEAAVSHFRALQARPEAAQRTVKPRVED